jgi:hypothetical protein
MQVSANEFMQQYEKLDEHVVTQLVIISQTTQEHPPILNRLKVLQDYQIPSGISGIKIVSG